MSGAFVTPCWCGEGYEVPWNDHEQNCPWFITEGTTPRGRVRPATSEQPCGCVLRAGTPVLTCTAHDDPDYAPGSSAQEAT